MSWSSGKDSTLSLDVARRRLGIDVTGLLCTVNHAADRVAMHAVRRELLEQQAHRLGLPVHVVELPFPCSNEVYEGLMSDALSVAGEDGITQMIFGDLFLEDVRAYRERALAPTGLEPVFPLWGRPTPALADVMVDVGIKAIVTCVDPAKLAPSFCGRSFDREFLADLPRGVDPCGERGEFHTFVWDGPGFAAPLGVDTGEIVERDGFVFCDVVAV